MKVRLVPLVFFLTSLTGVCPQILCEVYVRAGEMVALQCPCHPADAKVIWTSYTGHKMNLTSDMSSAEQRQMSVLVHGRSLVILSFSVNHQGNYSCSLGWLQYTSGLPCKNNFSLNATCQSCFRLTAYTTLTREDKEKKTMYPITCPTQKACTLKCPDVNIPAENIPNMTEDGITWHKKGESLPPGIDQYFSSVEKSNHGVYTCTRSYLHQGQIYNITFTVELNVEASEKTEKSAVIISPHNNIVILVDLGSPVLINCTAVMYTEDPDLYWVSGDSFVEENDSLPVFYNETRENNSDGFIKTASLVFKKVSEEDLSKTYTCKMDSTDQDSSFVNITLALKPRRSYISLASALVSVVVVMVVTVVVYVKFKVDITLFLRDTLGLRRSPSDGKSYDAFLMFYESNTDSGLSEDDRVRLESVLEERLGYSLCLYDRDVLPGKSVAEAVLSCVEQSRTVVLLPTFPDPSPGSGLLSAIHAALVERQTRLIFIKTESTAGSGYGPLPEVLQLLYEAGDCVTWRGKRSMPPSSSFWKQLRYNLPAPKNTPKIRLLTSTI